VTGPVRKGLKGKKKEEEWQPPMFLRNGAELVRRQGDAPISHKNPGVAGKKEGGGVQGGGCWGSRNTNNIQVSHREGGGAKCR